MEDSTGVAKFCVCPNRSCVAKYLITETYTSLFLVNMTIDDSAVAEDRKKKDKRKSPIVPHFDINSIFICIQMLFCLII